MVQHWLLRVGDGDHYKNSRRYNIWGIKSSNKDSKNFIKKAMPGDVLWFIKTNSGGQAIGVAVFVRLQNREVGPLIAVTRTNDELGWTKQDGDWDKEVHYTSSYDLTKCNVKTQIKSPLVIRKFNRDKVAINLPTEYDYLLKYINATEVTHN